LAYELKRHGLDRVNISLHSLRRTRYYHITGVDKLGYTMKAIEAALDAGIRPVKLNMVVLRNFNDDELDDLISYSYELGGCDTNVIQLIELLKIDEGFYKRYHIDLDLIEEKIKRDAVEVRYRKLHNRPVYVLKNNVAVEFVKPMHNQAFCMGNDRIRITYDGKFKPCLMRSDNHVDFLTPMRNGASDDDIAKLYLKAVLLREPFYRDEDIHLDKFIPDVCII
jgi:cyclic pyranopterin phosphate synthase